MGNCQAVDAAALVIQHPSGSIERMYWPISASEVMKTNPGHYVSLIIPLPTSGEQNTDERTVRFTRVKLLRPSDTLVLGRAYRLVTSQDVMKALTAKKYAKMKKNQSDSGVKSQIDQEKKSSNCEEETEKPELEKKGQATRHERHRQSPGPTNFAAARSKLWRPSLHSISEGGS
ncbi:UPF0398 protein like [Actinidia chinensis var. chinensis]|uniref:UPF0398 protein like n=1 Tax=Actinidia chinensis var. chinensis TaxID=1590841 RepID=A0A2R6P433_ACTCC|nr:UPF0398 protein like [Actinidia chinensis var. chinensis]